MTTTNYPNGLTSFGIPLYGGGARIASGGPGPSNQTGRTWFVNAAINDDGVPYGSDGNPGSGPNEAFATMERAFESLQSGDIINFCGRIGEQLVTPANVFDVWINGMGNRPRHADSTPFGGNLAAAQWGAPTSGGVAAQATLRVLQQGWRFTNFLMTAVDLNAACLEIVRNAGAGDAERDASHAEVFRMRFSGAGIGIRGGVAGLFTEIPFNVEVGFSQFDNMTTAMSAAIECNQWYIHDNFFGPNTSQIIMAARNFMIARNMVGAFTAAASSGGIDLRGGVGANMVFANTLSGTYSNAGGYQDAADDNWYGNFVDTGVSSAVPG